MFAERKLLIKVLQVDKWSVSASISRQLDITDFLLLGVQVEEIHQTILLHRSAVQF